MRRSKNSRGLTLVELLVGLVVSGGLATICTTLLVGQIKALDGLGAEASVEAEFALFEAELRRAWQSRNRLVDWQESVEPFSISFRGSSVEADLQALGWPCVSSDGHFRFRLKQDGTIWILERVSELPVQARRLSFRKLGRIDCLFEEDVSIPGGFPRRLLLRFPDIKSRPTAAFALW